MTSNKRLKNKIRTLMETTGVNYVRAARDTGSAAPKDPARLTWSPGTFTDGSKTTKAIDTFLGEFPHLLISGISASEPETMLSDMIDQLTAANSPVDLQLWINEPYRAMSIYRESNHVTRYVDDWTPDGTMITHVADQMEDAVAEMDRRNKLFIDHEEYPKNLSKARALAMRESLANGTTVSQHPLYMPYIVIVVNETASLFSEPPSKRERTEQERLVVFTAEIARKSRSAGIFLVFTTNRVSNASVPTVIRNQMRSIGLTTANTISSHMAIHSESLFGLPTTKAVICVEDKTVEIDRNPNYVTYSTTPYFRALRNSRNQT